MHITTFHLTKHGETRLQERDLLIEQVKATVNYPDRRKKQWRGVHGGFVYAFVKKIDGRFLEVVAEIKADEAWLVTEYWLE